MAAYLSLPDAAKLDRWWVGEPFERYWMEVSDRGDDLGVDLNAPLLGEDEQPFWSYDLVDDVSEGDIVLHYDRSAKAVVGWSFGVGRSWSDTVVWGARAPRRARRTSSRTNGRDDATLCAGRLCLRHP
jgi:hypothetical protein